MADGIKKINENVIKPGRALTLTNTNVADYEGIPSGTLKAITSTKGLQLKISNNNWSKFDAAQMLLGGSITTELLANGCVTTPKIADLAVTTEKLGDNSVTTIKLKNSNVTTEKINNLAVTTSKINNEAVTTDKVANSAITTNKLKDESVITTKLANRSVTEIKIAEAAVTNYQIAKDAVQTKNILDKNVTFEKIADGAVYGAKIPDKGIDHMHLRERAVTTAKIAPGAVTGGVGGSIGDHTITTKNIAFDTIQSVNIAQEAVMNQNIANDAVSTKKIKDGNVTRAKLSEDVRNVVDSAVTQDANGHVKIKKSLSIGTNPQSGYALSVDGDLIANKVYNAVYMDIAESYLAGEELEPGDIVAIREDGKVYKANKKDKCVVGVISNQYAVCFGATPEELQSNEKVAVGLIGKVNVKVKGKVKLGDYIAIDNDGIGRASRKRKGRIGKVIEHSVNEIAKDEVHTILCQIFPN